MPNQEYELARNVLKLANRIMANRNRNLCSLDMTTDQADTLHYFNQYPGSSIRDLKVYLGVRHQTAQGIVARLREKGLLSSTVAVRDARFRSIELTDAGREMLDMLEQNGSSTGEKMLEGMSDEEKSVFTSLIGRAYENVNGGAEKW